MKFVEFFFRLWAWRELLRRCSGDDFGVGRVVAFFWRNKKSLASLFLILQSCLQIWFCRKMLLFTSTTWRSWWFYGHFSIFLVMFHHIFWPVGTPGSFLEPFCNQRSRASLDGNKHGSGKSFFPLNTNNKWWIFNNCYVSLHHCTIVFLFFCWEKNPHDVVITFIASSSVGWCVGVAISISLWLQP